MSRFTLSKSGWTAVVVSTVILAVSAGGLSYAATGSDTIKACKNV